MHDYRPQFHKAKTQIVRKVLLFFGIALIATSIFFNFEQEPDTKEPETASGSEIRKITLPGQSEVANNQSASMITGANEAKTEETEELEETGPLVTNNPPETLEAEKLIDEPPLEAPKETPVETIADAPEASTPAPIPSMSPTWESRTIRSGDSLANIFKEWKLSSSTLHKIVNSSKLAKTLADIHPGETLKLLRDDDDSLLELMVVRSPTESLLISKTENGYESEKIIRDVDIQLAYSEGQINSSLFVDGQNAGLTDAQIMEMAGIFGWDIDFALELRKGDSFKLLYEEHFLDGNKLRNGPILMAEFNNDGKLFKAVRYQTPDGNTSYYDPDDGRNKKRAFIRTPVKFARISSRFTNGRFHPVLKKWRAHRGVDYAAPTGTPIKAAGNGKVIFRGTKGGYGKTVIIQHGTKYTTLYAHLSKYAKSSKKGRTIKQGQIIGYVGKTGLATGPHLHYEFRVNGVHRNPLTVKLPKADPINSKYRKDFDQKTAEIQNTFDLMSSSSPQVAQSETVSQDG